MNLLVLAVGVTAVDIWFRRHEKLQTREFGRCYCSERPRFELQIADRGECGGGGDSGRAGLASGTGSVKLCGKGEAEQTKTAQSSITGRMETFQNSH
jgi:hypothetical protein